MPELDWSKAPIHQEIKADWTTPEILIEGSLNCGKTTVGLDKEVDALLKWPGIRILLFRWVHDDVLTKLKPDLDVILDIRGLTPAWNKDEKCYVFENESRAYLFGLKTQSSAQLFSKIRGLGVSRIAGDQVEEVDPAVAGELRGRLRPNLKATVTGRKFPFQLTFISNTEDFDFWLSREFPLDNHITGRRVYSLSVFDNPYLPQESIDSLLRAYAPDHPKFQTMIMGRRGPNVTGTPVFEGLYRKDIHWRPVPIDPDLPILESFEFGKHNPTWVFAQQLYAGGLSILGGLRGEGLVLEDFLTLVQGYRKDWFPVDAKVASCIAPMGGGVLQTQQRYTPIEILRKRLNITPLWRGNGNAADVRLALVENISTYLRRRNMRGEESLAVNNDETKFLIVSSEGTRQSPFVHHALEAGFVWDKHFISIGNKEVKQPREDDKFANAMHCIENIELNFCAGRETEAQRDERREAQAVPETYFPSGPLGWMG